MGQGSRERALCHLLPLGNMNKTDSLHDLFLTHNNALTLRQLKENWEMIGSNETGRISDLRKRLQPKGMDIICEENREYPSMNLYRIVQTVESSGQRMFV